MKGIPTSEEKVVARPAGGKRLLFSRPCHKGGHGRDICMSTRNKSLLLLFFRKEGLFSGEVPASAKGNAGYAATSHFDKF
jgi:hypothetical protein